MSSLKNFLEERKRSKELKLQAKIETTILSTKRKLEILLGNQKGRREELFNKCVDATKSKQEKKAKIYAEEIARKDIIIKATEEKIKNCDEKLSILRSNKQPMTLLN